jgi:2-iminobutanoate/2-iminopropanoate deaminase
MRSRCCALAMLLAGVTLVSGCTTSRPLQYTRAPGGPVRPFTPAVLSNGFIYLSGQIGTDSTGRVVAGGIQPETRQTMENIRAVLLRAGSSMDRIVKCTVFIADMREWDAMNEVYVTFFDAEKRPARSALGANGLALNARVEIECLAAQ